ncbi:hypothetical protein LX32DRAFT_605285 [Colletotrichum zoysiae]|uniref:Uncharacterized protein n=1 Tax=Colletotrichum zoysiae TaxID=1216348 RepID=A0AAD9H439_9PEZI|nr:hypothetical protein LX32DRAFT_605285 [Colletotrichum zoysiae]
MCKYVSHVRVCNLCNHHDTVLISERLCVLAKQSGGFGSCDTGISSDSNSTSNRCWKCKERTRRIPYASPVLRHVSLR